MIETKFKQTEIGPIPEDWEVKSVEEFAKITTGSQNTQDKEDGGKYPFYVRSQNVERIDKYIFDADGVVTAGDGVGTGKVYHRVSGKFGLHQRCYLIYELDEVDVDYFYWVFSIRFYERVMSMTAKSSVDSVRREMIADMLIPLPPLAEQKKIAKALSDVDCLIDNIDSLIAKKRNVKQGAMQQLLTGRLRIQGFNEPWKRRKLKEIAEMNSGGTPSSKESQYYGGKINFLSISDMTLSGKYIKRTDKTITELGLQNSSARLFPSGTLMYAMYASLGKCSITQVETAVSQAILGFKLTSQIDRDYLYHHFNFIEEKVKMMGQTGTQSNLSKSIVENFDIILPCIEEQKAIANILNDMDDEIFALEAKKAKYESIREGMMQELLTGKIRLV